MSKITSNGKELTKSVDHHLGRITLNNLRKWKEAIHQVELSSDEVNTHEEVRLRSVRVAGGLQSRGLGVGDVIVICVEVKRMLEQGTPKIIFCDPCMEEIFTRALRELNIHVEIVIFGDVQRDSDTTLTHITPFSEFLKPTGNEDSFEVADIDPQTTIAAIICSSGSTGLPKGVCLTHYSLLMVTQLLSESEGRFYGSHGEFFMSFSNYYWISAMWTFLYTCISGTPRINCALPYSIKLLQKGLTKYKPKTIYISPVICYDIIHAPYFEKLDLSSLKYFLVGGSFISDKIVTAIETKLANNGKVCQAFASTETGCICVNIGGKPNSVGKPLPWFDWKIVDIETGKKVNPGEKGELIVKSETLFKCYLNNPEATKAAFDEDGYYKTGDLLTYDEEGFLYYIDRVKELIKFRNFQVTPTEVENEIRKLPGVLQVCVVGKKDERDGEHPVAFVLKSEGSKLTEQDIKDVVKNSLADHKQLRGGVVFIEKIQETRSGKIDRNVLKKLAQTL